MTTLQQMITAAEEAVVEQHDRNFYGALLPLDKWEDEWCIDVGTQRLAIGELIMTYGGMYSGMVGEHSLVIGGLAVDDVDDGYRGLLLAWIDKARQARAAGEAVPA